MPYQPEIEGKYKTAYLKTLIRTKELNFDVEKMEFLSRILTNPNIEFYESSEDSVKKFDHTFNVVLEKGKK